MTATKPAMSARERRIRKRLRDDFPYYGERCLKVKTKAGGLAPLALNRVQLFIHGKLEEQLAKMGKVRALILKGRQGGASTYIGGRFYHRATHRRGLGVFILTHEQSATDTLFGMVERFQEHCPALVKPHTSASNAKELKFDRLDSEYYVGTAGSKAVGRSKTIHLFHGSEVAFWPFAPTHFAGVVQAVPDETGTEIVLESTANGMGNEFHERWQMAEAGMGDYIAIFVPWYWSSEYSRPVPKDFRPTADEQKHFELHRKNGMTMAHMVWRRAKILELKDPLLFKQEYPATAQEAFQTTGHDSFIKSDDVLRARNNKSVTARGPLVIGADPARFGDDRFSVAWRQGRKVLKVESRTKLDSVKGANWLKSIIDRDKPARVFVDVGGVGAGVIDILHDWGGVYEDKVVPINFGSAPQEPEPVDDNGKPMAGPRNRRAEMWMRSRDWLRDPRGVSLPNEDSLHADACGPGYKYDVNQCVQLESKEEMRKRGVRSPDIWDAVALTFAEPVHENDRNQERLDVPDYGVV